MDNNEKKVKGKQAELEIEETIKVNESKSLFKVYLERFKRNKLSLFSLYLICAVAIISIVGPMFIPQDPNMIDMMNLNKAPNSEFWFGTDHLGRNLFARVIYGGRASIAIGFLSSGLATILGTILGLVAGYYRGFVDKVLLRISEFFQIIPRIMIVMVIVAITGSGVSKLIIVFMFTGWMTIFRIARNEVIKYKEQTFVVEAKVLGVSDIKVMFSEILPNIISAVVVSLTVNIPYFILEETSLSFLGLGVPNNIPTWGTIINSVNSITAIADSWWVWSITGIIMVIFCAAVNFVGDGLRDAIDVKTV